MKADSKTRERARRMRREMTRAETILWTRLRRRQVLGAQFRRQMPVGPYIADFACPAARLIVEVDGETHWTPEQRAHDERRRVFLEGEGWSILRVWNADVCGNEDGVIEQVMDWVRAGVEDARVLMEATRRLEAARLALAQARRAQINAINAAYGYGPEPEPEPEKGEPAPPLVAAQDGADETVAGAEGGTSTPAGD